MPTKIELAIIDLLKDESLPYKVKQALEAALQECVTGREEMENEVGKIYRDPESWIEYSVKARDPDTGDLTVSEDGYEPSSMSENAWRKLKTEYLLQNISKNIANAVQGVM